MLAGCCTSVSASPRLTARRTRRSRSMNTRWASSAEITAPVMSLTPTVRKRSTSSRLASAAPAVRSPWPPRYFVAECTTTSAPSSIGRCSQGVAQVLSTISRASTGRAISASAATSTARWFGFDGVSVTRRRVRGPTAAAVRARSVMSTKRAHGEASELVGEQRERAAVERAVGDDVVARLEQRPEHGRHRAHGPRRSRARPRRPRARRAAPRAPPRSGCRAGRRRSRPACPRSARCRRPRARTRRSSSGTAAGSARRATRPGRRPRGSRAWRKPRSWSTSCIAMPPVRVGPRCPA